MSSGKWFPGHIISVIDWTQETEGLQRKIRLGNTIWWRSFVPGTQILGLLHNLGDGCRHTATAVAAWRSPRRGEIFMTAISSPRRHSSPFGDTHRHLATPIAMATPIAIWRHPSPFGDRRRQGETNRIGL